MGEVIESRRWRNIKDGRTASIYGSVPYQSDAEKAEWTIEVTGWTVKHPDGTTGLGRPPFETQAEALAWVAAHPNFKGMSQG